jgi:hypothetical protein
MPFPKRSGIFLLYINVISNEVRVRNLLRVLGLRLSPVQKISPIVEMTFLTNPSALSPYYKT